MEESWKIEQTGIAGKDFEPVYGRGILVLCDVCGEPFEEGTQAAWLRLHEGDCLRMGPKTGAFVHFPTCADQILEKGARALRGIVQLFCSVCKRPQVRTVSGLVCVNGHGGAPSLTREQVIEDALPSNHKVLLKQRGDPGDRHLQYPPINTNNPKELKRRIYDLIAHWAPRHAVELIKDGWQLSENPGLTWIHTDKPLRLPDRAAEKVWAERLQLRAILLNSAGPEFEEAREKLKKLTYESAAEEY